jgi:tetratricopeptide (TPR) repeat protein
MSVLFLSYARKDGDKFSSELRRAIRELREGFTVIRDQDEHYAGFDWQDWIASQIRQSDALLFVMTRASIKSPTCKKEWRFAQNNGVRVIPLLVHPVAPPFGLGDADYVDFTKNHDAGLRELAANLHQLQEEEPQHRLRVLEEEHAAAQRDLEQHRRLDDHRALKDVEWARERLEQQQHVTDDPEDARRNIDARITRDLANKRPPGRAVRRLKVRSVNEPPYVPDSFRDRRPQTRDLLNQLRSDSVRLVVVMGREGIGKSALVGRVMTAVSKGEQLEDTSLDVSGLVYLKTTGLKPFSASTLLTDLGSLLDENAHSRLKVLLESPGVPPPLKLVELLNGLGDQRIIVLIDNFERLVDPKTWELRDDGQFTSDVILGLIDLPSHKVKVVLTTQRPPHLPIEHPSMLGYVEMGHEGLPSPYAEEALRAMDRDGSAGLRDAPEELLTKAQVLTGGHPKALEALYSLLMASREVSLDEIVQAPGLPQKVADALIGKTFGLLGREEQRVLQALAIYDQPVSAAAVDFLLRDHLTGLPAEPVLGRLVRMRLVLRHPGQLYGLVLVSRQWVLDTILVGDPADRHEAPMPFTRIALLHRGATYFKEKQPPDHRCRRLSDLTYHLGEIDLRTLAGDDVAVDLLVRVAGRFLFDWGHAGLVLKLLQPLEEQMTHPVLRVAILITSGRAYRRLGDHDRAIDRYHEALRLAKELPNLENQAVALTNLGACHYILGQATEASRHYRAARTVVQRIGDRTGEVAALSGLCLCLVDEGRLEEAARIGEHALDMADEEDQQAARQRFNLGLIEVEFGHHRAAMEHFEIGRQHADRIGYQSGVGRCQQGKAEVLLDRGDVRGAMALAEEAVDIGNQVKDPNLIRDANFVLAMARLQAEVLGGDPQLLDAARAAAEAACRFRVGNRAHGALAVRGVIALRQGQGKAAVDAFRQAELLVRRTLDHGAQNYGALDTRGLALSGLALLRRPRDDTDAETDLAVTVALSLLALELDDASDLRRRATEASHQARGIAAAPGAIGRVRRLLDALPDSDGFLDDVKRAATRGGARTVPRRRRDPKLSA